MVKLNITQKLLFLLLAVSLIPLSVVTLYWYRSAQSSLRTQAMDQQTLKTNNDVNMVNQYITDKVNALIIHSQAPSVQQFNTPLANDDLKSLIEQDGDIQQLVLADPSGQVALAFSRSGSLPTNYNISNRDAFKATTYLAGKEYISSVATEAGGHTQVTIAVPLVTFSSGQNLSSLTTAQSAQIRKPNEIKGVLIESVSLDNLWRLALANNVDKSGYSYVVDSQGNLITYPTSSYMTQHPNLSTAPPVATFLSNPTLTAIPRVMTSEKGVTVLSSYGVIPRTNWAVITIEPLTTIFAVANRVALVGVLTFIISAIVIIVIGYMASRRLTTPIKQLAEGAQTISTGDYEARVAIQSTDEIGVLATAFNNMASNLSSVILSAKAEATKANVILNNVSEGIVAVNDDQHIVLTNLSAATIVGQVPAKIAGMAFADLYNLSVDNQPFTPPFNETRVFTDVVMTNPDKRIHYVDLLINPIRSDPLGIRSIITILDKTAERELENMKLDFVSMAAHELRTPLTSIRGYLDLISRDESFSMTNDTRLYFDRAQSSAKQLVGLINNLLNASRIERNALILTVGKLDYAELVHKAVADQQFTAHDKSISLTYDGPSNGIPILADQVSVQEVINNLLSNAINYTPSQGHIMVKLSETDAGILTEVIDDGIGIPAQSVPQLFTKFYRARSSQTSGSGGTGLGLYISKSIVDLLDGTISVTSEEGHGSTFSVLLPKFDQKRYNEIIKVRPETLNQKHGWITKNITR